MAQNRSNRKDKIRLGVIRFKDGKEIKAEDFDGERDLTDEQREYIAKAFAKVFNQKEEKI